jgi:RNA polymerase sigma factor (TIGR02999 family)
MSPPPPGADAELAAITQKLSQLANGESAAENDLIPLVYEQLRSIARNRMLMERPEHTLQATELVHEALLRLKPDLPRQKWKDRAHFFQAAAETMRRILIDHARRHAAQKRGANVKHVPLDLIEVAGDSPERILALNDAFSRLMEMDEQLGQIASLRLFASLSVQETAEALEISPRTVVRGWAFARAWLGKELEGV